jgi:hypothetical protein
MTFKKHDEYKWFNLSDNIIVVNITDNDLPARGQGFDEDSDTLLICPNKKLAKLSKECQKYPTPINGIKGVTTPRKNTMKDLAELDGMLQSNYIGKICNKAQIINSYMNEAIANELDQKIIDELFDASSKLSSLSQVEIDKAKKSFDNIKMAKELGKINHIEVELGDKKVTILDFVEGVVLKGKTTKEKKLIKSSIRNYIRKVKNDKHIHYNFVREYTDLKIAPVKMIVPNFFDVVAEDNTYRSFRTFKTPMDYLQQILDEEIVNKTRDDKGTTKDKKTKKNNQKPPKFRDLLVKDKSLDCKSNVSQKDDIFKIIEECGKTINGLKVKNKKDKNGNPIKLNKNAKKTIIRNAKEKALNDLIFTFNKTKQVERKINSATILQILREAFPTAEKKKEKTAENKKIKEQNESITDKDKKIKKVTTFSDYARLTLTLLYNAKIFETLRCFKNDTNEDEEILIRDFKGDINIFGEKYSLKTRKDLILKEESTAE